MCAYISHQGLPISLPHFQKSRSSSSPLASRGLPKGTIPFLTSCPPVYCTLRYMSIAIIRRVGKNEWFYMMDASMNCPRVFFLEIAYHENEG